jgi:hypothetical protein
MIAPPLTGASMHYHYTAGAFTPLKCAELSFSFLCIAANALIYGAKRWFLINPEQAMYATAAHQPFHLLFLSQTQARGGFLSYLDAGIAANTLLHGLPRTFQSFASRSCTHSPLTLPPADSFTRCHPLILSHEQGIKILECTQTSGDILYVPSMCGFRNPLFCRDAAPNRWGHSVLYLSNTIGIAKLFSY